MSSSPRGESLSTDDIDRVGSLVDGTIKTQLRQAIRAIYDLKEKRSALSEQDKQLKTLQEKIEGQILGILQGAGLDMLSIDEPDIERRLTVTAAPREFFNLSSKERFLEFVFELQDPDLLSNVRPAVDGMRAYRDTHDGNLPPGVAQSTSVELSLRTTRKLKRDVHE